MSLFVDPAPRRPGKPETRRRIAEAAAELIAEQGYAATSLQRIAQAANVHVQTIFLIYGTKLAVLEAATRVVVAGPDDFEGLGREWTWVADLQNDPDPVSQLRRYAHHVRTLADRAGPLTGEIRSAARSDPEVAAFLAELSTSRFRGPSGIANRLHNMGALRPGLDPVTAADTLHAISGYESYDALVRDRRWTPEDYEQWLGDLFCRTLLGRSTT